MYIFRYYLFDSRERKYGLGVLLARWVKPPPGPPFFMFLLYLDASGTPDQQDANSRHYVLVGLCVRENTWFALNKRFEGLKRRYSQTGFEFELHARDFAVGIAEQNQIPDFDSLSRTDRRARVDAIRQNRITAATSEAEKKRLRKKFARTAPFIHLTRLERSRLFEDALDLVGAHNGIRLFGEAVSKSHPGVVSKSIDPVHQAFEQVVSRFDTFLAKTNAWRRQANPQARVDNGLLILDQDYSTEAAIQNQFTGYRRHGHPWGQVQHVIDIPFFASSEMVCGLQLVDVCAYAVRRYLDTNAIPGSHEERNFLRIFQKFDRDNWGNLHGLRHYVPADSCNCRICQTRGHSTPGGP